MACWLGRVLDPYPTALLFVHLLNLWFILKSMIRIIINYETIRLSTCLLGLCQLFRSLSEFNGLTVVPT
jgi:hypothetical protein